MRRAGLALLLLLALGPTEAPAQSVTSAFQGFSGNSKDPVRVEADRLEVRERDKAALFSGNVQVSQGESRLRAKTLTVLYDDSPQAGGEVAGRQIRRLEASGGVVVTARDQRATGETGVFDMRSNTVVLSGGVVVTQGTNVIRGDRLLVDLTKQTSRVESAGGSGRVEGIFTPSSGRDRPAAPAAPAPRP